MLKMRSIKLKKDKGVAGLTVLLSVVAILFVIGFLIFIFALMGGELQDSLDTDGDGVPNTTAQQVINTTSGSLVDTVDWFPIVITITVMVVLILLTVIIISAIRSSGLLQSSA
jgi:hypothetical protein